MIAFTFTQAAVIAALLYAGAFTHGAYKTYRKFRK
jgi:hypothetical protein